MKHLIDSIPKSVSALAGIAVLFVVVLATHTHNAESKGSFHPAAGTTPVVSAKITLLSKRLTRDGVHPLVTTTMTDSKGNFTLTVPNEKGGYIFSLTPGPANYSSGRGSPPATFTAWVTFTSATNALLINENPVTSAPFAFSTDGTFTLGVTALNVTSISGTITK